MKTVSMFGLGWLGLPLAKKLASSEWTVLGTVRSQEKAETISMVGITVYPFHFPENSAPDALFESDAAIITLPPGKSDSYLALISHLAEKLASSSIQHILFTSSTSVYPECNAQVDETYKGVPDSETGKILLEAERILFSIPNKTISVLRLGGLIGEGRNPGRFLSGKKNIPNPDCPVNLLKGEDAVEIIAQLVSNEKASETYNIVSSEHPSRKDFYTKATQDLGLEVPLFSHSDMQTWKLISNQKILVRFPGFEFRTLG